MAKFGATPIAINDPTISFICLWGPSGTDSEPFGGLLRVPKVKNELPAAPSVDRRFLPSQKLCLIKNCPEFLSLQIRFGASWMYRESYETYLVHRTEWLADHWRRYVVIAAYDFAGFFPTYAEAYEAGRLRYYGAVLQRLNHVEQEQKRRWKSRSGSGSDFSPKKVAVVMPDL